MKVHLNKVRKMVEEDRRLIMGIFMKVNGLMVNLMDKEHFIIRMVLDFRELGKMD